MRGSRSDQRGSATVTGLMLIGVLVVVAAACSLGAAALVAQRKAQSGADLVALAAAGAIQRGGDACAAASAYALANKVVLDRCAAQGEQVLIVVSVPVVAKGLLNVAVPAQARAGPG